MRPTTFLAVLVRLYHASFFSSVMLAFDCLFYICCAVHHHLPFSRWFGLAVSSGSFTRVIMRRVCAWLLPRRTLSTTSKGSTVPLSRHPTRSMTLKTTKHSHAFACKVRTEMMAAEASCFGEGEVPGRGGVESEEAPGHTQHFSAWNEQIFDVSFR